MTPKPLWKSRTFWFNVIMASIEIGQLLAQNQVIDPKWMLIATGVGNIIIRLFFTDSPATLK